MTVDRGGSVCVFGSINTDLVTYVEHFPRPSESVAAAEFETFAGGKGANQAVAAARAGAPTYMFGCVGDDIYGRDRITGLIDAGVMTEGVVVKPAWGSGIASIMVDSGGENFIAVAPGANGTFRTHDIDFELEGVRTGSVAVFQNEIPLATTVRLIKECRSRGMIIIWNAAPALARMPEPEALRSVDFLVCNEIELAAVARLARAEPYDPDPSSVGNLATVVRGCGVADVIVTRGAEGAEWLGDDGPRHLAAFPVRARDSVGAGDCLCGVLAASLALGASAEAGLRRATAAAAISVTRQGAQASMPTAKEIEAFLAEW